MLWLRRPIIKMTRGHSRRHLFWGDSVRADIEATANYSLVAPISAVNNWRLIMTLIHYAWEWLMVNQSDVITGDARARSHRVCGCSNLIWCLALSFAVTTRKSAAFYLAGMSPTVCIALDGRIICLLISQNIIRYGAIVQFWWKDLWRNFLHGQLS